MMQESMRAKLKHFIVDHESYRKYPYSDTKGKITIGIGYNLTDRGMQDSWINSQYEEDILHHYNNLVDTFAWFLKLNEPRQIVILDMCFNLGWKRFLDFKNLHTALNENDFQRASVEMLNSEWAREVKDRSIEDSKIMLDGEMD